MNGIPPGIGSETKSRIQRILKMTGHPALDMLENFIDEGVMEVIRIYSRNKKYEHIFPKFFPEFEPDDDIEVPEDENDASTLFHKMREKFGWGGTYFMRSDVESMAKRDLTDEEWDRVKATASWRKGLQDRLAERGWHEVEGALHYAGIIPAKCKKCGSELNEFKYCQDITCPYYSYLQEQEFIEG